MPPAERARQTFQDVILPLLETAVPLFAQADIPDAFAFEVSHHVRKKMLGVAAEGFENVVLILPKASAMRYMTSSNQQFKQAALAEGQAFLNAEPIELWPGASVEASYARRFRRQNRLRRQLPRRKYAPKPTRFPNPSPRARPRHSPKRLKNLQKSYQSNLDRMVQEIDASAHFVRSMRRRHLYRSITGSIYKSPWLPRCRNRRPDHNISLAALAFDQHIVHLIRPALEYFKDDRGEFDGIDFSTHDLV